MFIIDFRNKLVSDYRFSVIGNSNVDKVDLVSHFIQYADGYSIYLKVRSEEENYVDKIAIASEDISVDEDVLVCRWTMGAVSTQCKKLYLQLQFEKDEDIIAQSRIVSVVLGDTINVDELIPVVYPQILKEIQNQIDTLNGEVLESGSLTYANDTLSLLLSNKNSETLVSLQVAIETSTSFVSVALNGYVLTFTERGGNTHTINFATLFNAKVDKVNTANKVYATDENGNQATLPVDDLYDGNVVRRHASGQIQVPITPTENGHASSKGYTDAFAKSLAVSIDSDYVITFTLKDANNNTLATQTIDLPLESVVVSGSYDDTTKSLILVLENGQEITIPVSDLVDGLVSQNDLTNVLLNYYTKSEIEAKYYSTENVSNLSTMGELRAFVENVNNQGKHCLFDLHSYIADAYVCVIHCWSSGGKNYCFVQDLVNHKTYGNYSGYVDSTTIASYFSSNAMANIKVIKITDEDITMAQISTLLQEINTLGDYVMFDVSAITSAMYLTTIYINGSYYRVFDSITGRTASGTSTSGLDETLLSVIEGGVAKPTTWEEIHNLIVEGNGSLVYSAGDELDVKFFNSFVATTDDTGITIDVDRDEFVMKTDMATADYVFTYNGNRSTWQLNENDVDIAEYGITITGTPTNGKKITIDIVVDTIPYIVMGNDQETSANNDFTHSLTLRRKYARTSGLVFDEKEAFFYNGTNAPLQAGTYHFLLGNHSWYSADVGKYFQFTLTQDLPVGGQLVWQQAYNATLENANIKVFTNALTTTETETCVMTEGQGGTYLGVINNGKPDNTTTGYSATYNQYLNQCQRALLGNNDDEQSNNRQWLNSDKAKGTYAQGQNGWDRIASYVLSDNNGFLYDLDPHLRKYLGVCSKITESVVFTTTSATSGARKTTSEKVWKLSREEIQSCSQSEAITYPPYTYYHNLLGSTYGDWRTDTRFILTNESGTAQYVFLRSPYTSGGNSVRGINTSGIVSYSYANGGGCRVECFAIV